jgi:hypothetical protein
VAGGALEQTAVEDALYAAAERNGLQQPIDLHGDRTPAQRRT